MVRCRDSGLKNWAEAISERTEPSGAGVALARKLAVIMLGTWKSGRKFDPEITRNSAVRGRLAPNRDN